jgi:hypothetical protein
MIRLASTLPKGSEERKAILKVLAPKRASVRGGLRRVRDEVFYWSTDRPAKPGLVVPPFEPWKMEAERLYEKVRREINPQAPSRLKSVFVCPRPDAGFCDPSLGRHVYRVRVTGTVFTTDGYRFTEGVWKLQDGYEDAAYAAAVGYWKADHDVTWMNSEESLVDGKVVVEAEVPR